MNISTYVTHGHISLFVDTEDNALNDWGSAHVAQGFSWRPRSVSFCTISDGGPLSIETEVVSSLRLRADAQRVIQVPFEVDFEQVAISDTVNFYEIMIPVGRYQLTFQHGWGNERNVAHDLAMWCVFTFVLQDDVRPVILLADPAISIPSEFVMEAKPAY